MSFLVELWNSILTPGTTPTLILSTHVTFALLVITLTIFVFLTKSIHLINLLVLSILLWGTLTWFINEINKQEISSEEKVDEHSKTEQNIEKPKVSSGAQKKETTESKKPIQRRSKKI